MNWQLTLERFSYDLEMKIHEQNKNQKWTAIERFKWFIEWMQMHLAFGWLSKCSGEKLHAQELSRDQRILCFDVVLQQD